MEGNAAQVQRERIVKLAHELDPSLRVQFHDKRLNPKSTDIRFRLKDTKVGKVIASIKVDDEWGLTNTQDKSDAELRDAILRLINSGRNT